MLFTSNTCTIPMCNIENIEIGLLSHIVMMLFLYILVFEKNCEIMEMMVQETPIK